MMNNRSRESNMDSQNTPGLNRLKPTFPPRQPEKLANLLGLDSSREQLWLAEEHGDILRHLLSTPILAELPFGNGRAAIEAALASRVPPIVTFAELLTDSSPPKVALEWVKRFAKGMRKDPDARIPEPVSVAMYYSVIAAAKAAGLDSLTKLSREAVREGLQWLLDQDWIMGSVKNVAVRAMARDGGPGDER